MAAFNNNASYFDFHCLDNGAKWYACPKGSISTFVGCCLEDPCAKGCTQGSLRPVGFNISHYGEWPDGSCGQASNFYSCTAGDSFWGCCKSNPCAATPPATCPSGDLVPAFMDQDYQFTTFGNSSNLINSHSSKNKNNAGAIAGGVVGGLLGLSIIGALILILMRKKRRGQTQGKRNTDAATIAPVPYAINYSSPSTPFSGISSLPSYPVPLNLDQSSTSSAKHTWAHNQGRMDSSHGLPSHRESKFFELAADIPQSTLLRHIPELPEAPSINPANGSSSQTQTSYADDIAKQTDRGLGLGISMEGSPPKY